MKMSTRFSIKSHRSRFLSDVEDYDYIRVDPIKGRTFYVTSGQTKLRIKNVYIELVDAQKIYHATPVFVDSNTIKFIYRPGSVVTSQPLMIQIHVGHTSSPRFYIHDNGKFVPPHKYPACIDQGSTPDVCTPYTEGFAGVVDPLFVF